MYRERCGQRRDDKIPEAWLRSVARRSARLKRADKGMPLRRQRDAACRQRDAAAVAAAVTGGHLQWWVMWAMWVLLATQDALRVA